MVEEIEEAIAGIEEEDYQGMMPIHNKETARHRIAALLNWAKPGNRAWQELEAIWGFVPDYDINDAGNERE